MSIAEPLAEADRSMQEFAAQFDHFSEVVTDAMRYGPSPSLADRFLVVRAWLLAHHAQVRTRLRLHLPEEKTAPASISLMQDIDVFDRLLTYPTLDAVVNSAESTLHARLRIATAAIANWRGAVPI